MRGETMLLETAADELAAGHDARAIECLRELFESTTDADVIDEIRTFAVTAHESSTGFHRIEWERLAIDAESRGMVMLR